MSLPRGLPLALAPSAAQLCGLGSEGAEHQWHQLLSEVPKAPLPAWPLSPLSPKCPLMEKTPCCHHRERLHRPRPVDGRGEPGHVWPGSREAERAPEARRCARGRALPARLPPRVPAPPPSRPAPAEAESPISSGGLDYYFLSGGI